MKQNNFEININSLFVKIIINFMYLCLELLLCIYLCKFTQNIVFWNVILFSSIIVIGEIYRQDNDFNIKIINLSYKGIFKLKTEPYLITKFIDKILNISFIIFFVYQVIHILNNSLLLSNKHSNIFQVVSIVITVSSIVLTVLYTILQQFENKYSDFDLLIKKWKNTSIILFITLALYTTCSFLFYYFGSNHNIDLLILIASIYVLLKLILTAINVSFSMNFEMIIRQYSNSLIKWIKNWKLETNYIGRSFDVDKFINEIFRKGIRNYIKYKIWGINQKISYSLSETTIKLLEEKLEPIFRMAEYFLKDNNLNNFKYCIDSIYKIILQFNKKCSGGLDSSVYSYVASKVKKLYILSIKLNYQTFPEYIVELNKNLGLLSINTKNEDDLFNTIQTTAPSSFIENNYIFIISSLNLEDTPAPSIAIRALDTFAQKFIYNNSINEVAIVNSKIESIVTAIYDLNNKKKVINNAWCLHLIILSIISLINIIYNLIKYELVEQNPQDINYILENTIKLFNKLFNVLTTYKGYSGNFTNIFYSIDIDTNLQTLTTILERFPNIKTPYCNSILNKNPLYINKINALNNIFNAIFISDFINTYNFEYSINNLKSLLSIYSTSVDRLIKTEKYIGVKSVINAFAMIQNYVIIFISRIENTDFNKEQLFRSIKDFMENYYANMVNIIKLCSNTDFYKTLYLEELVSLARNTIWLYHNNDEYKNLIIKLFTDIISINKSISESRHKLELFKALNLITLFCSKYDKRLKLFKILIKFIRENLPIEKPNSQFDFNGTERNFLPHYSSHFGINYQEVLQYAKILDNNTN